MVTERALNTGRTGRAGRGDAVGRATARELFRRGVRGVVACASRGRAGLGPRANDHACEIGVSGLFNSRAFFSFSMYLLVCVWFSRNAKRTAHETGLDCGSLLDRCRGGKLAGVDTAHLFIVYCCQSAYNYAMYSCILTGRRTMELVASS